MTTTPKRIRRPHPTPDFQPCHGTDCEPDDDPPRLPTGQEIRHRWLGREHAEVARTARADTSLLADTMESLIRGAQLRDPTTPTGE